MNLKKKLTLGVILTLPWGYIYVYDLCSQTSLLVVAQISGEHLQRTTGPQVLKQNREGSPLYTCSSWFATNVHGSATVLSRFVTVDPVLPQLINRDEP